MAFVYPLPIRTPKLASATLNPRRPSSNFTRPDAPNVARESSLLSSSSTQVRAATEFHTNAEQLSPPPLSLSELSSLQQTLPTYFRDIKSLHTKLQATNPPPISSIVSLLSPLHDAAIRLQATLNHPLTHLNHLTTLLAFAQSSSLTARDLFPLLSPTSHLRDLLTELSLVVSALLRCAELDIDIANASPLDLLEADRALHRYRPVRRRHSASLRNPHFCCVPWPALRSHRLFIQLPPVASTTVTEPTHLVTLRQDSEAFAASRRVIPLLASTIWRLLGFGEDGVAHILRELLPPECAGHEHVLAGWRALLGGGHSADEFERRFDMLHVPNAVISYLEAEQAWFDGVSEVPRAPVLRIRECGLVVGVCDGFGVIGCTPLGRVQRRLEEDFWGWSKFEDRVVIAKTESVYKVNGTAAEFQVMEPRMNLDALSYVEAQVTMLVCGEVIKSVDVVWHGIMGGMRTFRVKRDDAFIALLDEYVAGFREKFAGKKPRPPPAGFHVGELFDRITESVIAGCRKAECVHHVTALLDELRVSRFRRSTPKKFKRWNERMFLP